MSPPSETFSQLQAEYHRAWLRYHPEESITVGLPDYAHLLRCYSDDDNGALITLNIKLLSALDEVDIDELEPDAQIDYRILRGAASIELHELQESNWRFRDPMQYLPVNAIYQLLTHPVDNIHTAIKKRLTAIPQHLRGARSMLGKNPERIVPAWLENAIDQGQAGAVFLRNLVRHPLISRRFSNPAKLQTYLDEAARALEEFAAFLESEIAPVAQGKFACGRLHFERLLNEKHFMATDADALIRLGERLLEQTRSELVELTRSMRGDDDVTALLGSIRSNHPEADGLLDVYRERMRAGHKWLQENDLVTLPERQALSVQQTPEFMTSLIPFAAYDPPMMTDRKQHGYYYITLPDDAGLDEHNYAGINLACAHETFPGHHMQFVLANQAYAGNITRALNTSASLYEGWALYCEQLVIEQGLLNNDEHRFMMLRDKLWRCLRVIIDAKTHTGAMTAAQACAMLVDELGFTREQADAELAWYTSSPTTPLCYATGCEMILQARGQVVDRNHAGLKVFHDRLLRHGSIALPLVLEQSFSPLVWQRVHTSLFSKES